MPQPSPLRLSLEQARLFQCRATGLHTPQTPLAEVFARLGYVQVDPLNVCGRMHDLILRNRAADYGAGDLHRFVHAGEGKAPRAGFEHYLPQTGILAAIPFNAWRYVCPLMQVRGRRSAGYLCALDAEQAGLARRIMDELREKGPMSSDDFEHQGTAKTAWGTRGTAVKAVLEKLFAHGRVLISARRGFRRIYDLPERILPKGLLEQPAASPEEVARWSAMLRLRQRRLVALKRTELALVADSVCAVEVPGCPVLHCLREDAPLLDEGADPLSESLLLAPLDPLIVDRRLTRLLWDFDYTWEVYTPAAKRVRGYYTLPVLKGFELLGHVEPRLDREKGRVKILSKELGRACALSTPIKKLERFLKTDRA